MTSDDKKPPKEPYHSPVVEVYGDIRVITKAVAMNSQTADGGTMGNSTKTA